MKRINFKFNSIYELGERGGHLGVGRSPGMRDIFRIPSGRQEMGFGIPHSPAKPRPSEKRRIMVRQDPSVTSGSRTDQSMTQNTGNSCPFHYSLAEEKSVVSVGLSTYSSSGRVSSLLRHVASGLALPFFSVSSLRYGDAGAVGTRLPENLSGGQASSLSANCHHPDRENLPLCYFKKFLTLLLFFSVMIGFATSGCGINEDTGFARVRELRVAGVVAEPAEPLPGESVHLNAVAVDPESRELAYLWFNPPRIVDPKQGIPEGVTPIAFSSEFDWTAPEIEGTYTLIVLAVPMEYFPELVGVQNFEQLQNIPHAIAFKNINVTSSQARNHNPVIEDVIIDPPVFDAGDTITLTAIATDPDGDELQYAWLSITPGLSSDYENPVDFLIPPDGYATVYLVVRDSRGGVALRMIEIQ